jgi:FtsP/CotA-like multicopper oxidase with cupredoxin domain
MQGYQWSINNVAWSKDVQPLKVAEGERVELALTNQTMMPHPMHLHGHSFQVVAIDGHRFPGALRDTGVGASENDRDGDIRRRQSGMVGFSLPPFVP